MDLIRLQADLKKEEGSPDYTYLDSKGILSGGIGRNLIDEPEPGFDKPEIFVPEEMETKWFQKDIQDAIDGLNKYLPWWTKENDVRQNALLDLCFNMGVTGLLTFKTTLGFFQHGMYIAAASGIRNSQYARDVGPIRSSKIAKMIETGEFQ